MLNSCLQSISQSQRSRGCLRKKSRHMFKIKEYCTSAAHYSLGIFHNRILLYLSHKYSLIFFLQALFITAYEVKLIFTIFRTIRTQNNE